MNIKCNQNQKKKAFTLIEMIGVLAVIAILAALLIPKIFEAINSARINNCVVSYNTIKTATMDHYGKYGGINVTTNGATMTAGELGNYDLMLLSEGLIDKPFAVKVGTSAIIQAIAGGGNNGPGYDLDGNGTVDTSGAAYTVEAVISGIAAQDAMDISTRLDGATLTATNNTVIDKIGRVEYAAPVAGTTTLYMYITHR